MLSSRYLLALVFLEGHFQWEYVSIWEFVFSVFNFLVLSIFNGNNIADIEKLLYVVQEQISLIFCT